MSLLTRLPLRMRALWAATGAVLGVLLVASVMAVLPSASSSAQPPAAQAPAAQVRQVTVSADAVRAQARTSKSLVVIGDSVTRIFNDKPGSSRQGFWSMVARQVGANPKRYAQGGAGFVKPGLSRCKGRNFIQQISRPELEDILRNADLVIIEGGRNDTRTCHKRGFKQVTPQMLREAVDALMDKLVTLRGRTDDCTVVVSPWGPKGVENRAKVVPVVARETRSHGFTFVDTTRLLTERTTIEDGVHPTRTGNLLMARQILRHSYAQACFY